MGHKGFSEAEKMPMIVTDVKNVVRAVCLPPQRWQAA